MFDVKFDNIAGCGVDFIIVFGVVFPEFYFAYGSAVVIFLIGGQAAYLV